MNDTRTPIVQPIELFDTHAHLDEVQLFGDVEAIIRRAHEAGVANIVTIGTTANSSQRCVEIASKYSQVYAAVGIQPNYIADADDSDWEAIVELSARENVVAIGETGLDCYWDYSPLPSQEDYFRRHIQLARTRDLPFIVHLRESASEILTVLQQEQSRGDFRGVMHSFTGNADELKEFVDLGMHISFAGMVTFKKSIELRNVAKSVPDDRLLIETDAPYLSPHPKRGQRPNEPSLIIHTAKCLAEARGTDFATFCRLTTMNARRFFGLVEA